MQISSERTHHAEGLLGVIGYFSSLSVPTFICLSGFLLCIPIAKTGNLKGGWKTFLKNRAFRILPAYWTALAVALVVAVYVTRETQWTDCLYDIDVWSTAFLMHDFVGARVDYDRPMWSLAPEWHIYFTLPIAVYLWNRIGLYRASAVIFGVIFSAMLITYYFDFPWASLYLYVIFYIGALAARIVYEDRPSVIPFRALPWGKISGLLSICFIAFVIGSGRAEYDKSPIYFCLFWGATVAATLVALSLNQLPAVRGILEARAPHRAGEVSYSLYLLHWPVLAAVAALVPVKHLSYFEMFAIEVLIGMPIAFGLASLSYWFIESPYFKTKKRISVEPQVSDLEDVGAAGVLP